MTEPKKKKRWIKAAIGENKGKLHEKLGVPKGEKIPEEKLSAALKSKNPETRREANLAKTLKGFHRKKKAPTTRGLMGKMYGKKSLETKE